MADIKSNEEKVFQTALELDTDDRSTEALKIIAPSQSAVTIRTI